MVGCSYDADITSAGIAKAQKQHVVQNITGTMCFDMFCVEAYFSFCRNEKTFKYAILNASGVVQRACNRSTTDVLVNIATAKRDGTGRGPTFEREKAPLRGGRGKLPTGSIFDCKLSKSCIYIM